MDELTVRLVALAAELNELFEGEFAVLRDDESLCVVDKDSGVLATLVLESDEDGDDCVRIFLDEYLKPAYAAAIAVTVDQVLPVIVDTESTYQAYGDAK